MTLAVAEALNPNTPNQTNPFLETERDRDREGGGHREKTNRDKERHIGGYISIIFKKVQNIQHSKTVCRELTLSLSYRGKRESETKRDKGRKKY